MISDALGTLLVEASSGGVAPRLDAAIWVQGELHELSSSAAAPGLFDLASLTKPLASGLVAMSLVSEGRLDLDAPTDEGPSVRQLLDHSAGYKEWHPFFKSCFDDPVARRIFVEPWQRAREAGAFDRSRQIISGLVTAARPLSSARAQTIYGDVGFMKLQQLLEATGKETLDVLFERRVARPLGLELRFLDLARDGADGIPGILPTGSLRPRPAAPGQEQELTGLPRSDVGCAPGQVDDDNAFALGGIAGHAGLFGTARAVAMAGARFLEECEGARRIGSALLARAFCGPSGPGHRGLGWDRPSEKSSLGTILGRGPRGAVGHLGYTGTSLWIDCDRRVVVALCSNRVQLGRENLLIRDFRPRFHDAVARALGLA